MVIALAIERCSDLKMYFNDNFHVHQNIRSIWKNIENKSKEFIQWSSIILIYIIISLWSLRTYFSSKLKSKSIIFEAKQSVCHILLLLLTFFIYIFFDVFNSCSWNFMYSLVFTNRIGVKHIDLPFTLDTFNGMKNSYSRSFEGTST